MTMTALCPTLKDLPWAIGVAFISSAFLAQSADAGEQLDGIEVRLAELEQRIEELAQAQRRADNDVRPDDAGSAAWTSWTPRTLLAAAHDGGQTIGVDDGAGRPPSSMGAAPTRHVTSGPKLQRQ